MVTTKSHPKHQQVFDALQREIQSGRLKAGDRLPSEAELERKFGASRITVGRAVRDLQSARDWSSAGRGSGSFVKARAGSEGLSFGLLIPDLGETEIFEPICQGMMASPLARQHALLWGSLTSAGASKEERAWQLCRQYIDRRVSGVFFAPLELTIRQGRRQPARSRRRSTMRAFPLVLLDRTVVPYPERGASTISSASTTAAPAIASPSTCCASGARRIAFVAVENAAATVDAREAGYREALYAWNAPVDRDSSTVSIRPTSAEVRALMESSRPDAIVCANDWTAARLMHTVLDLGYAVPGDVRLVGIDDMEYAQSPAGSAHHAAAADARDRRGGVRRDARPRRRGPTGRRATSCCRRN